MIYLSGSCSIENRTTMQRIAERLRSYNYEVYCPFELKIENAWNYTQEQWAKIVFNKDRKALNECDTLILISPGRASTAGSNWEQGYAYASGKRVIVIQYTNEPTSLMTYCGCERFINTTPNEVVMTTVNAIYRDLRQTGCNTILT